MTPQRTENSSASTEGAGLKRTSARVRKLVAPVFVAMEPSIFFLYTLLSWNMKSAKRTSATPREGYLSQCFGVECALSAPQKKQWLGLGLSWRGGASN